MCNKRQNQHLGHKKTKLNICDHALASSTQLQNWSFHVVERTRTSTKCQEMKNARAKRAKILFFIVKYANLWGFCCRRRRGFLSSRLTIVDNESCSEKSSQFYLPHENEIPLFREFPFPQPTSLLLYRFQYPKKP